MAAKPIRADAPGNPQSRPKSSKVPDCGLFPVEREPPAGLLSRLPTDRRLFFPPQAPSQFMNTVRA